MSSTPLFIIYGSATGNCETIAKTLSSNLPKKDAPFYTSIVTCEGNSFRRKCLGYWKRPTTGLYPVLIITSTTGNGDAPENIGRFVRFLKKESDQILNNLCFAVLALGDTNYDKFCASGKIIDRKMNELGGKRARKLTMADEATGLEDVVDPWLETIMKDVENNCGRVSSALPLPEIEQVSNKIELDALSKGGKILLELTKSHNISIPTNFSAKAVTNRTETEPVTRDRASSFSTMSSASTCHYNINNPYKAQIIAARYLTNTKTSQEFKGLKCIDDRFSSDNERDLKRVIELTLGMPEDLIAEDYFQPGDSIGLLVDNRYTKEYSFLMSWFSENGISLKQILKNALTVEESFLNVDVTGCVRKPLLLILSQYATNSTDLLLLQFLSCKEGNSIYEIFIKQTSKNITDMIQLFSFKVIDPQILFDSLQTIAPRYYSIANSPYQSKLSIAFSCVDFIASNTRKHGLATSFLEIISSQFLFSKETKKELFLNIFPKLSTNEFRLPIDTTTPLILIGPGTGISPFIGFLNHLQQLDLLQQTNEAQTNSGTWRGTFEIQPKNLPQKNLKKDMLLFFGCRWSDHDYLYKDELRSFQNSNYISHLFTSFSRDTSNKQYVQQNIEKNSELINSLLDQNASIYICGDVKMAKDVEQTFCNILNQKVDATLNIQEMKKKKKFLLDIWN